MTHEKKVKLVALLGTPFVRLLLWTLRFHITDRARLLETPAEKPLLWAFWHNRLFIMAYIFERYFKPSGRIGAALISQSKDGDFIAAFLEQFGGRPIRGSSSRGGARSLIEMKRAIQDGYIMAVTPDGPRGPRYSVSPGVIKLAQITHGIILPVHITYSSFWQLKSWDGFMVPKPFARVDITFDELHEIPDTTTAEEFEYQRVWLERMLRPQHGA